MGKYAVIGDSYAVVDDDNSHWAKIWGDQNGHTVDFFGLEGGNLVNISYLFENIPFKNYDGFIIHYTSPLRAEGSITQGDIGMKKISTIVQMSDVYTDETKPIFEYIHPNSRTVSKFDVNDRLPDNFDYQYYHQGDVNFTVNYHNMMPHWYDSFELIDTDTSSYDYIMTELCNKFYDSVSIRWLLRANFLAYRNIILTLNAANIKNITVFPTCGGFNQTINHINTKYPNTKIWDQTAIMRVHPAQVQSRNHISLDHAQLLASKFSFDG
jgi:predicted Rdx family selenoprotein